ncbi:MAG: MBL fold metallo-hydrolase [Bacteroidota bacterium]
MTKLLLIISIFLSLHIGKLYGNDSIAVTYIANCGFLIETDVHKIIVDGLFKRGHNHYPTPDTTAQKHMVSNLVPFNDIDLILVSHSHEDHFDSDMVAECMLNNPSVRLLCPQQVIDSLTENESVYGIIKPRIIECTPDTFVSQLLQVDSIVIHACRFAHPGEEYGNVQNIAYLIAVNGISIFHSADIDPAQINRYTGVKINEMNIDIGMINEDFAKIENAGLVKQFINAKYNIAMHLPESAAGGWLESLKDKPEFFSNPFIFIRKMEKKVFYFETGE